jgi:glycosyltransferase involved in cell wall biosynthesis
MSVGIVIPARNEAAGIKAVLDVVQMADVGPLVVVDDGSTDGTGDLAADLGAAVLRGAWADKGSAMAAGLAALSTTDVLFLDADLVGLGPLHVSALATVPPHGGQVVGLRDNGVSEVDAFLPQLSGERRLPVAVAARARLAGSGWAAEQRLNAVVGQLGLAWRHYLMVGVTNPSRPKPTQWATVAAASIGLAPELARYVFHPAGSAR